MEYFSWASYREQNYVLSPTISETNSSILLLHSDYIEVSIWCMLGWLTSLCHWN